LGSTTTQTTIVNRALQLLGYKAIGSITDNDRGAKAMNRAYYPTLESTLRSNYWSFAVTRAVLPALATAPAFGKANYFATPADYIMIAPADANQNYQFNAIPMVPVKLNAYNDWQIEMFNGQIVIASDQPAPLQLRYISSNVTESMFDPMFSEGLSACLAMATCEELTQSNTKLADAKAAYAAAMDTAKKRNAFEGQPEQPPVDPWILARM
jgi:hypothetical protein